MFPLKNLACKGLKISNVNPTSAGPMCTHAITVPADALAINGARPSAGTGLTTMLRMFSVKFFIPYMWSQIIYFDQMTSFEMADELFGVRTPLWEFFFFFFFFHFES